MIRLISRGEKLEILFSDTNEATKYFYDYPQFLRSSNNKFSQTNSYALLLMYYRASCNILEHKLLPY